MIGETTERFSACGVPFWYAVLAILVSSPVWAQATAQRSGIVRISPGVPGKIPGTGFIVKLDGRAAYILTAAHVVEGDTAPKVEFFTQRNSQFTGRVADGADWGNPRGLALLIVDAPLPPGLTALAIDANTRLEGEEAITAIGHPVGGGSWSVIPGSVTSRQGGVVYFAAQVDKGNSGGPVLHKGKVVGIVTNKGTFGEAVAALTMVDFLAGSGIDITHPAAAATPAPSPVAAVPAPPPAAPPPVQRKYRAGEVFTDGCSSCPEMVVVPADKFTMGSPVGEAGRRGEEGPQHEVTLGQPFAVGKAEVTRGQFRSFVQASGWKLSGGCYVWDGKEWKLDAARNWENPGYAQTDEHPVVCVTHEDAQQYVRWLSQQTKQPYRLPSEEEWEYAARAGSTASRYWGNSEPEACRYANVADRTAKQKYKDWTIFDCEDGYTETAPVGRFKANGFGLYDMLGNVWEWVEDCYSAGYDKARDCSLRVVRGGAWDCRPQVARAAYRFGVSPGVRGDVLGFRVARTLP